MRATLAFLAAVSLAPVSLAACAKGGAPAKPKVVGPAIDAEEAEQGASDLVTEIYAPRSTRRSAAATRTACSRCSTTR
jgi:hypothetical protein